MTRYLSGGSTTSFLQFDSEFLQKEGQEMCMPCHKVDDSPNQEKYFIYYVL